MSAPAAQLRRDRGRWRREVLDGLATDEKVFELALGDHVDGLRGDAFIVYFVGADEVVAGEGLELGIVGDVEEVRQDGSVKAGGIGSLGASGGAHLGAVGFDVGDEEAVEDVGGGVAAEEDGAVVVVG